MDVEHGGVQQRVDVLQALEPGLQPPAALRLQLPQLLLGQPGQGRRRGGHRGHWHGEGGRGQTSTQSKYVYHRVYFV